jgi:hypothetical protein
MRIWKRSSMYGILVTVLIFRQIVVKYNTAKRSRTRRRTYVETFLFKVAVINNLFAALVLRFQTRAFIFNWYPGLPDRENSNQTNSSVVNNIDWLGCFNNVAATNTMTMPLDDISHPDFVSNLLLWDQLCICWNWSNIVYWISFITEAAIQKKNCNTRTAYAQSQHMPFYRQYTICLRTSKKTCLCHHFLSLSFLSDSFLSLSFPSLSFLSLSFLSLSFLSLFFLSDSGWSQKSFWVFSFWVFPFRVIPVGAKNLFESIFF